MLPLCPGDARLGRYTLGRHALLRELGLLLGAHDGPEVILKPLSGGLADRTPGSRPSQLLPACRDAAAAAQ